MATPASAIPSLPIEQQAKELESRLKRKQWILYGVLAAALVVFGLWVAARVKFDWTTFFDQLRHVEWKNIVFGVALIWLGYGMRAVRWAILLKPQKKVTGRSLIGSQVIGYTAVALLGRPAELVRLFLVVRRTRLTFSSQVAVYTVERMFDLGAMALIFSAALLLAPDRATLPHHEALQRSAIVGLALAIAIAVFAFVVRASGNAVAGLLEKNISSVSPKAGQLIGSKIRAFRDGLNAIHSFGDFVLALAVSLLMWGMIVTAYLATTRSFVLSPQLASMTLGRCMVLIATSMAASSIQLPVIGWFTQTGFTAGVMQKVFGVAPAPALGCGAMLLIVTFLSVIPLGLVWARFEHVSLKQVSEESEHLAEEPDTGQAVATSEA
jgi:glycosyltransferase 2 family protein